MTQQPDMHVWTEEEVRRLAVDRGNALNLSRILVPLDGRRSSEQILPFASMIADWFSGEIMLFHSLPPTHPARGARLGQVHYPDAPRDRGSALAAAYLDEIVSRLGPHGIKARWGLATGHAAVTISSRSTASSYGIIAMASNPRTRTLRLLAPGLLEGLWKTTSVPLLIVNPNQVKLNGVTPHPPGSLIFPYRHAAIDSALPVISAIAGASRSSVTVVVSTSQANPENEQELLSILDEDGIYADIEHAEDDTVGHIQSLQSERPGSWIVASSKMRSGLYRSLFGSTADRLTRDATGPIMIVPDSKVKQRRLQDVKRATRELADSL
ncbi:MAG: universal stress protein [Chloroflexi bacterium]|nr:universal stress protein [Chloroflexota bacterium]